jgi:hypothetical protein
MNAWNRLLAGLLLTSSVLLFGAPVANADPPVAEGPFVDIFNDVNPCTGLVHTITITTTSSTHSHDGMTISTAIETISTSSGFSGSGRISFVDNGQIERFHLTDVLFNEAGDRILLKGVFVLDLSTDTVRVDSFDLTCVG